MIVLFILNDKIGNNWHLYHGLDVNIEKMSQLMHFAVVYVTTVGTVAFCSLMALINYFVFDLGTESYEDLLFMCVFTWQKSVWIEYFIVVYHFRVPFDWRTPYGYLFMLAMHAMNCVCTTNPCQATLSFLLGSIWALLTIVEDVTNDLDDFAFIDSSNLKRPQFIRHFCKVVEQFSNLKQLSGRMCCTFRNALE